MTDLREVGQDEIGDQRADVEAHRAEEGEFWVDDANVARRRHDRAGVKVAMNERFGAAQEFELHRLGRRLERAVGADFQGDIVELRRRPVVQLGVAVGIGEHQILSDLAQLGVGAEHRNPSLLFACGKVKIGRLEQGRGHEFRQRLGETRVFDAGDQAVAHDDMRRQVLHDDERLGFVEQDDFRRQPGRAFVFSHERLTFEERAIQRQRPGFADQADVGQRLLNDHRPRGALDDEHQIEIPVADLGDAPFVRATAQNRRNCFKSAEVGG